MNLAPEHMTRTALKNQAKTKEVLENSGY